jgi:microcystin-dependent protein
MSDQFVAEIRMFPFNFPPTGWAFCNGQLLPISQNTALFSLVGTFYGGNGTSNFALPNLQGSAPLHQGQGPGLSDRVVGETGGEVSVTLLQSEIPAHNHAIQASTATGLPSPTNNAWGSGLKGHPGAYASGASPTVQMSPAALTPNGGNLPHNNMPPYLALNFCIAMQGIFPPRS